MFALFGSSVVALKRTSTLLCAAAALLVWRVGRRAVGKPAAVLATVLFWTWTAFLVYWSTKSRGFYGIGLVLELLRRAARPPPPGAEVAPRRDRPLAAGLGWGDTRGRARRRAVPRLVDLGLPGAAPARAVGGPGVPPGAAPWLLWNAFNGWKSLFARPDIVHTTYLERLGDFFWIVLPTWLGLRTRFSLEWLPGAVVGVTACGLVLAGLAFLLVRDRPGRARSCWSASPSRSPMRFRGSRRTQPSRAISSCSSRFPRCSPAGRSREIERSGRRPRAPGGPYASRAPDVAVPSDISPLLELLERERANRIRAAGGHWLAGRITYESDERLIASTSPVKYKSHELFVRAARNPAWVFLRGSTVEREQRARLEAQGYRRIVHAGFVVYVNAHQA